MNTAVNMSVSDIILEGMARIDCLQDDKSCSKFLLPKLEEYKKSLEKFRDSDEENQDDFIVALIMYLVSFIFSLLNELNKLYAELQNKKNIIAKNNQNKFGTRGKFRDYSSKHKEKKKEEKNKITKHSKYDNIQTNHKEQKICVCDLDHNYISYEEALERLKSGTIVEINGNKYKYVELKESRRSLDLNMEVVSTTYYKIKMIQVDDEGNEIPPSSSSGSPDPSNTNSDDSSISVPTDSCVSDPADSSNTAITVVPENKTHAKPFHPDIDFLPKTLMSISLFTFVADLWMRMQMPLNRISKFLQQAYVPMSRQMLYSYTNTVCIVLTPLFEHMQKKLADADIIHIDETYWSCRNKQKALQQNSNSKNNKNTTPSKRKPQRSKSKTNRSYIIGLDTAEVCLYFHSLTRNTDVPKDILIKNNVKRNAFVITDGFYKKNFNKIINEDGSVVELFIHATCWIHSERNFWELFNCATDPSGEIVNNFKKMKWEQDIQDTTNIISIVSLIFKKFNEINVRCSKDTTLNIQELKDRELRPIVDALFEGVHAVWVLIKDNNLRDCSALYRKAIGYLINNEERLKVFLDHPISILHNNPIEEKFRDIDILRKSSKANDTVNGAINTAMMYSFYKTAQLHNVDFRRYLDKVIRIIYSHIDKIELERDSKGTIIGYKSHCIPDDVLEGCLAWDNFGDK